MRCVVEDMECVSGRLRRGMCERHYRRFRTHGTTEATWITDPLAHYLVDETGCWVWQGDLTSSGYGKLGRLVHETRTAHIAIFIETKGPYNRKLDLDHLCRVRACVNPDHLDPVPRKENLDRGHQARTFCKNGLHDITQPGAKINGTHQCKVCWRRRYRAGGAAYRARLRGESG